MCVISVTLPFVQNFERHCQVQADNQAITEDFDKHIVHFLHGCQSKLNGKLETPLNLTLMVLGL